MAIDEKTIKHLLEYLEGEIKIIHESRVTKEVLDKEEILSDATKHRMQVAVEAVINIAEHIVAGLNLGKPEFAKELFPLLVKAEIMNEDLSQRLQNAVGLRNILVHMYREVNLGILAESATTGLDDLREFAKKVDEFLALKL